MEKQKYKVENSGKLKSWEQIARKEIHRWLTDEAYENKVTESTMKNESMGPFTKFLYHFFSIIIYFITDTAIYKHQTATFNFREQVS